MPLAAVRQLQHLQRRVRAALPRVSVPLLVAHGAHDRTANPADAREIHARVRSEAKQLRLFGRSGHLVPVDHDAAELAEAVTAFLTARPSTAR